MQGILYSQPECLAVKDLYKILHSHKLSAHCLKKERTTTFTKGMSTNTAVPAKLGARNSHGLRFLR